MCELPEGATEDVVFLIVAIILEMVALADVVFAVGGVGFVGVEVYFAEESGFVLVFCCLFFVLCGERVLFLVVF